PAPATEEPRLLSIERHHPRIWAGWRRLGVRAAPLGLRQLVVGLGEVRHHPGHVRRGVPVPQPAALAPCQRRQLLRQLCLGRHLPAAAPARPPPPRRPTPPHPPPPPPALRGRHPPAPRCRRPPKPPGPRSPPAPPGPAGPGSATAPCNPLRPGSTR